MNRGWRGRYAAARALHTQVPHGIRYEFTIVSEPSNGGREPFWWLKDLGAYTQKQCRNPDLMELPRTKNYQYRYIEVGSITYALLRSRAEVWNAESTKTYPRAGEALIADSKGPCMWFWTTDYRSENWMRTLAKDNYIMIFPVGGAEKSAY